MVQPARRLAPEQGPDPKLQNELSLTKIPCSLPHMPFHETNRKAGAVCGSA
jgi:hypothetical protein